jgi:hypothetical protein
MISIAFPDYDAATLPPIPATWKDISWQHDACPSWQFGAYQIFVDYLEADHERFSVCDIETGDCFLSSDNWDAVLEYVN